MLISFDDLVKRMQTRQAADDAKIASKAHICKDDDNDPDHDPPAVACYLLAA